VPKYKYKCVDCDTELVAFHSIKEKLKDCAVCGIVDSLIRIPGNFVSNTGEQQRRDVGALTREKIEEFKEELEKQKRDASGEKYD
jgi:hypothetical protein